MIEDAMETKYLRPGRVWIENLLNCSTKDFNWPEKVLDVLYGISPVWEHFVGSNKTNKCPNR